MKWLICTIIIIVALLILATFFVLSGLYLSTKEPTWSNWSKWSDCSLTCGPYSNSTRMRVRQCSVSDQSRCPGGISRETESCTIPSNCPIDGQWSSWTFFSTCSVSCGDGFEVFNRSCSDPIPQFGGARCEGKNTRMLRCSLKSGCPVGCGESLASGSNVIQFSSKRDVPLDADPFKSLIMNGTIIPKNEGRIITRIVGGSEAKIHEFPWQVSIEVREDDEFRYFPFCGGSLIDKLWVLTAAHCVDEHSKDGIQAVLEEHDIIQDGETNRNVFNLSDIIIHPNYQDGPGQFDYDFALLKLSREAEGPKIRTICLPNGDDALPTAGTEVVSSGWGKEQETASGVSTILKKVTLKMIGQETCRRLTQDTDEPLTDRMVCAGHLQGGRDPCNGDSGGPLMHFKGGSYELVGVTSWGVGCGRPDRPAVYGSVRGVYDWITSHFEQS